MARLPQSEEIALINIQYGVGFGVVFQYCFTTNPTPFSIWPSLCAARFGIFVSLVLYFFLDWLNANHLRGKVPLQLWRLLMWSIVIWVLAACVTLAIGDSPSQYVLLASYMCVVGVYHLLSHVGGFYQVPDGPRLCGIFLAGVMILVGAFFLYNAILVALQMIPTASSIKRVAPWAVLVLLSTKAMFVLYVNRCIQESHE